ncbi:GntR family transcriptional regulator [Aquicoccus sp. SCR17]|nr:GntR family transcriptional regulator [Carideicomes alvinocaridis]
MSQSPARTHTKRAVFELRQRIINGDLTGGTRLYEVALAEELQISRTPVREAMSRLAEEGLLERAPGGGFMVRSFTFSDVIDAIELRGVLEGTAARLAAERGIPESGAAALRDVILRLDACCEVEAELLDFDRYAELNEEFHALLARLPQSPMVARELERTCSLPFASPSAFLPNTARLDAFRRSLQVAQAQHRALAEAIIAREGARAEALAREHARIARANLDYVLEAGPEALSRVPSLALVVD